MIDQYIAINKNNILVAQLRNIILAHLLYILLCYSWMDGLSNRPISHKPRGPKGQSFCMILQFSLESPDVFLLLGPLILSICQYLLWYLFFIIFWLSSFYIIQLCNAYWGPCRPMLKIVKQFIYVWQENALRKTSIKNIYSNWHHWFSFDVFL